MFKLKIFPKRKLFYKETSQYGIYGCELIENLTPNKEVRLNNFGTITVVGYFPEFKLEKEYTITCKEIIHKIYGVQYKLISIEYKELTGKEGQRDFLKEIVTELQLDAIFKIYDNPVDEILNDTFDYRKVYGIGEYRYNIIRNRVLENLALYKIISAFGKYGLTYNNALYLHRKYKNPEVIVERINNNPYILMDLPNMGFKRADAIALNMGIENNDLRRINACIEYFLEKENNLGHLWSDIHLIESYVEEYIGKESIEYEISEYIKDNNNLLLIDNVKLTTKRAYNTEVFIKNELLKLDNYHIDYENNEKIENFIIKQEVTQGFKYDEVQNKAFHDAINSNIFILTGAAGSGKSTIVNGLLNYFDESNLSYVLLSPSAKAAKVLENYTNREAMTIHRGLNWTVGGFGYNKDNKLPYDIIIVDEISMVGIYLFKSLIEAIENGSKLILIGDPFQLPSIEPGSILDDLLQSEKFKSVKLTKVFRQAEESGIINIATKVRNGEYFITNNEKQYKYYGCKEDAVFIPANKTNNLKIMVEMYGRLLNKGYNQDDIIITVPTNIGQCGTKVINKLLQEINNPYDSNKKQIEFKCDNDEIKYFREGDKVIHIKNDYYAEWYDDNFEVIENKMGIFNGDIGKIIRIDCSIVWVKYDCKIIRYDISELENLLHAWCLSVHKLQGSSTKAIIMGLDSRHYFMAKRALVYTGITRASELLVFCGEPWLVNQAIDNNEVLYKRTFLKDLLVNGNSCIKEEINND